jgi:hypothetical protein
MFIAIAPTTNSGCFMAHGGNVPGSQYAFKTLEDAKKGMEVFLKTQSSNAYLNEAPLLIIDMDSLSVVSSVRRLPEPLPWLDRR